LLIDDELGKSYLKGTFINRMLVWLLLIM